MWQIIIIACSLTTNMGPDMHLCHIEPAFEVFSGQSECLQVIDGEKVREKLSEVGDSYVVCQPVKEKK